MNSLGHLILFLEHLNCLNALASKQTSKRSLHPRHCCLCGWNLYEISPPQGEKLNTARTTLKLSGGYPFTGWGSGQMYHPQRGSAQTRSNVWSLKVDSTLCKFLAFANTYTLTILSQNKNSQFLNFIFNWAATVLALWFLPDKELNAVQRIWSQWHKRTRLSVFCWYCCCFCFLCFQFVKNEPKQKNILLNIFSINFKASFFQSDTPTISLSFFSWVLNS